MVSTNGFPLLNDPPKDQRPESPCRGRRYRRDGSDHRNRSNVSVGSARGESGSFEKGTDEPVRSRKHKRKEKRNLTSTIDEAPGMANKPSQRPLNPSYTCVEQISSCSSPIDIKQTVSVGSKEQAHKFSNNTSTSLGETAELLSDEAVPSNSEYTTSPPSLIISTSHPQQQLGQSLSSSTYIQYSSEHKLSDTMLESELPKVPLVDIIPTSPALSHVAGSRYPELAKPHSILHDQPRFSALPINTALPLPTTPDKGGISPVTHSPTAPTTEGRRSRFFHPEPDIPPPPALTPPHKPSKRLPPRFKVLPPITITSASLDTTDSSPTALDHPVRKHSLDQSSQCGNTPAVGGDMSQLRIKTGGFFDGREGLGYGEGEDSDGLGIVYGVGWEEELGWEGRDEGFWKD